MTVSSKPKVFPLALCAMLLTVSVPVDAQQTGTVFRTGILDPSTAAGSAGLLEVFWQQMRKLGWIEGKNITIEHRGAEQNLERLPELTAETELLNAELNLVSDRATPLEQEKSTTTLP